MPERFKSLVDMQQRSCRRYANNRVLGSKVGERYEWLTYGEFGELVDRFRGGLVQCGIGRGDKVAVISNNRVEWAVAAFATYGLGAQYVPMYESQQAKEWAYIIRDSGAKLLLTSTEAIHRQTASLVDQVECLERVLCFDAPASEVHAYANVLELGVRRPVPAVDPGPSDVAGLIYTSGTTGNPKGVVLSHGNIISNVNAIHQVFPMTSSDVSCSFLPWAHSFGQTVELHMLISMGAAIGIAQSVQTLMDDFQEVKPTLLFAVPRIFNRIYDGLHKRMQDESAFKRTLFFKGLDVARRRREARDAGHRSMWLDAQYGFYDRLVFSKIRERFGGRLRYVFSGGAALSKEVGEFIDDIGIMVFEGYGLTETSPIATANTPDARRLGTIGKAIPGVDVYICDAQGNQLGPDQDGEIVVVGPNIMQGYYNHPEGTDEVIFELDGQRAFKTGDMGRKSADGFIRITGRIKEQYKLENGKYVVPTVLEDHLKLSGFIGQAFLYGDNRPYNVALVVPDFEALRKWAASQGIAASDDAALIGHPQVDAKIGEELTKYSSEFKGYERPKKWAVLLEDFTVDNGLLTPKLSVRRRDVLDRYRDVIEGLYVDDRQNQAAAS